jgi:hypothetical protein
MIEMNLIDSPSYIVGNYSSDSAKKNAGVLLVAIVAVLIPLLSIFLVRAIFDSSILQADETPKVMVPKEVKSRTVKERIVEEIIDSVKVGSVLEIPIADKNYEELAKWEQVDYEVKFNAIALENFTKIIPKGITFNMIKVSDYKNFIADGTAPDKETLLALLSKFRVNGWELLPKPKTNIRDGGNFYYFHIEAQYFPSMTLFIKNPINPANVPDILRLSEVKDKIVRSARASGLRTEGLVLGKSVNEPNEKKYTYIMKFNGDFQNVVNFVKAVSQIREPIRFESITMNNRAKSLEGTAIVIINLQ